MPGNLDAETILAIYQQPLMQLLMQAHTAHQQYFVSGEIETCTLANFKVGACPEDCSYCVQSGHYKTGITKQKFIDSNDMLQLAKHAKAQGAVRFCMGAAWRTPTAKDFPWVLAMIREVKALGLETCVTLGMLDEEQVLQLKQAGLDFYNHNLDTSRDYYPHIVTTHSYQDRLDTLALVAKHKIHTCCGGIVGLGETRLDRAKLLLQLSQLTPVPKSVPINKLIPMPGTPLAVANKIDDFELVRTIATARIVLPQSIIRLSAGRKTLSTAMQLLCFLGGANSIWLGDKLLTAENCDLASDHLMRDQLGLVFKKITAVNQHDKYY